MSKSFATRLPLWSRTLTSSGPSPSMLLRYESSDSYVSSAFRPLYRFKSPFERICFYPSFKLRRNLRCVCLNGPVWEGLGGSGSSQCYLRTGDTHSGCCSLVLVGLCYSHRLIWSSSSSSTSSASSIISRLSCASSPSALVTKLMALLTL